MLPAELGLRPGGNQRVGAGERAASQVSVYPAIKGLRENLTALRWDGVGETALRLLLPGILELMSGELQGQVQREGLETEKSPQYSAEVTL